MPRPSSRRIVTALSAAIILAATTHAPPADASDAERTGKRPDTYTLEGDAAGSRFEGIGVDRRGRTFYVSEVTGGEIHRGDTRDAGATEWKPEGADGRTTARGITVDRRNRVYIAGGPNGIGNDRPDLWVYDEDGALLASPRVGVDNAFLNDVAIGPDGAAYFTNSNAPHIYRVALEEGTWNVTTWLDATGTIPTTSGFNLGGIVVSPDRKALIVAQGNVGALWRIDLRSKAVTKIDTGGASLFNADGLVLRGHRLIVVRNFTRQLTTLRLNGNTTAASLISDEPTDPSRVFTTAKIADGRLLLVDSKFDEPTPQGPYEVVALPLGK
jgi:sugar lactone lactonase YvrE